MAEGNMQDFSNLQIFQLSKKCYLPKVNIWFLVVGYREKLMVFINVYGQTGHKPDVLHG